MAEPASIFDTDQDEPPRPDPEKVRALAEQARFPSREGVATAPLAPRRAPRIHRTGRTAQLALKTTPEAHALFYDIADRQKWLVGETFERAVAALERELARQSGGQG